MASNPVHSGKADLVRGERIGLRKWTAQRGASTDDPHAARRYVCQHEAACFCIAGTADLRIEGQLLKIAPGDSWILPPGSEHTYTVTSQAPFEALEATLA